MAWVEVSTIIAQERFERGSNDVKTPIAADARQSTRGQPVANCAAGDAANPRDFGAGQHARLFLSQVGAMVSALWRVETPRGLESRIAHRDQH
jgi:hypothetical protein